MIQLISRSAQLFFHLLAIGDISSNFHPDNTTIRPINGLVSTIVPPFINSVLKFPGNALCRVPIWPNELTICAKFAGAGLTFLDRLPTDFTLYVTPYTLPICIYENDLIGFHINHVDEDIKAV